MISIYPLESETLVVSLNSEEIVQRLSEGINTTRIDRGSPASFNGWVEDGRFELTVRLRRQQIFFPMVRGRIEKTSKGSLIFLTYKLFPGTRLLISFWTVVLPVVAIYLTAQYNNYLIGIICILFVAVVHIVARANFRLHLAGTRSILHRLLQA